MSADAPHDALVALLRRLSQKQRLALARVSKAWQEAVVKSLTTVEAQIDISKSYSLATWLKHHGGMVETLSIGSCQPVSPEKRMYIFVEEDPVSEVDVTLPCASLQKLHTLRLYNARLSLEGVTDDTTHNPFPSLTSLKAYESPRVCPYLHMLTSLKQLSLSDMDFPDGNLHRMAIALTALTRLRLEWTGDAAWEHKAQVHPDGFSRNGRWYEPGAEYCNYFGEPATAASAFTEDITFIFRGLPSLQWLELGCYTSPMRGDDTLSRKLECRPVAATPHAAAPAGASTRTSGSGTGTAQLAAGTGPSNTSSAGSLPRLTTLKIIQPQDIKGIRNMLSSSLSTITHLKVGLSDMHSLRRNESFMLTLSLLQLRQQLAHLYIGTGIIPYGMPASSFKPIASLSALTYLSLDCDAGPAGAMSDMFSGGPGSLAQLKIFKCRLNRGYNALGIAAPVRRLYDMHAMAAACPNLEQLSLTGPDGIFAQGSAASPAAECRALRSLTRLNSLTLWAHPTWTDSMFVDTFATMLQLRQLSIDDSIGQTSGTALTWPRLGRLSVLTHLQELDAKPLIVVTPKQPWRYPTAAAAPAGPDTSQGPVDPNGSDDDPNPAPEAALPPGVYLHQLLAEVAASEDLQRHAVSLNEAYMARALKGGSWVTPNDPGW